MKLFVAIEQHFVEFNGEIYTDIAFSYLYWKEYLQTFEKVFPVARIKTVESLPDGWQRADGENVSFIKIKDYLGFWDFLIKSFIVIKDCFEATQNKGCYLLRLGNVSTFCWFWLMLRRKAYAFEGVGHAGEAVELVKNVKKFGLSKIIAKVNHSVTCLQARYAYCASYTSRYVQGLYPTKNKKNEWIFSSVKLDDKIFTTSRQSETSNHTEMNIVSVGRIEPEKGHKALIQALIILLKEGFSIKANIVGPGSEIEDLKKMIEQNGFSENIQIIGAVPWGDELFHYIDNADLFILPSLTEGMPRALLEAMARGLPAIGSDTGGIKELLDKEYRTTVNDPFCLAIKIKSIFTNRNKLPEMSKTNFEKAKKYRLDIMNKRKTAFWKCILDSKK